MLGVILNICFNYICIDCNSQYLYVWTHLFCMYVQYHFSCVVCGVACCPSVCMDSVALRKNCGRRAFVFIMVQFTFYCVITRIITRTQLTDLLLPPAIVADLVVRINASSIPGNRNEALAALGC